MGPIPKLAGSMNSLSNSRSELERWEDALAANEEAVGIYQDLTKSRPGTFGPDLGGTLSNQSMILLTLRRQEDALAANEKAAAIGRPGRRPGRYGKPAAPRR